MPTTETVALDIQAIKALLPHRYPMLLVDRVVELVPGQRVLALKNVAANEPFFAGHFPSYPVMPGVLIVEALAQAGAVMMLHGQGGSPGKIPLFAAIERARFRRQVVPGDQLLLAVQVLKARGAVCRLAGTASVQGQVAAEAEITAVLGDAAA